MTDKINPQGRHGLDITQSKARAVDTARRSRESDTDQRAEAPRDAVELTNTATRLKRIEAALAETPEVDRARVDDVRQRLQSGTYEIDHEQLAQKMLRLDQDLG